VGVGRGLAWLVNGRGKRAEQDNALGSGAYVACVHVRVRSHMCLPWGVAGCHRP
jgi:hypothetical protein